MSAPQTDRQPLLDVQDLSTHFFLSRGVIRAVDGVSLTVGPGERVGIVGESGCGKSITARSILRLIPTPPAKIVGGQVYYAGQDLVQLSEADMRAVRGGEIAMVFQDPMSYLNPTMRVGDQIAEAVRLHHRTVDLAQAVDEAMALVGLPREIRRRYAHELSGGMRQRVLIAMALACRPKLLIADEPTTALDVTIQAQILTLLADLSKRQDMALLLITHDLGIVAELCDRVYVMYAGQVVEAADTVTLFERPAHPYTRGLLEGVLSIDEFRPTLSTIGGSVPDMSALAPGCRFRPRCAHAMDICQEPPPLFRHPSGQTARCWLCAEAPAEAGTRWEALSLHE